MRKLRPIEMKELAQNSQQDKGKSKNRAQFPDCQSWSFDQLCNMCCPCLVHPTHTWYKSDEYPAAVLDNDRCLWQCLACNRHSVNTGWMLSACINAFTQWHFLHLSGIEENAMEKMIPRGRYSRRNPSFFFFLHMMEMDGEFQICRNGKALSFRHNPRTLTQESVCHHK